MVIKKFIYTLVNPLNNQVFYVGYTDNLKKRYCQHLRTKGKRTINAYKENVIAKIVNVGLKPEMKIIDECKYKYNGKLKMCKHERLERYYIQKYRNEGIKLTNLTDGGEGGCTYLKPVYQYSEKGEFIKKYNSVNETANKYHVKADIISKVIDQRQKKSYRATYLFSSKEKANLFVFKETKKDNIPVIQYSQEGNLIKEYKSQKEASIITNVYQPNINHCLKKKRNFAGGFIWRYKNN